MSKSSSLYEKSFSLHFRQTDMAGIGYFAEVFNIFHDAYEGWAEQVCGSKSLWFSNPEWAVPIKKIDTEYFSPLMAFQSYNLKISVTNVGTSSFSLKTEFFNEGRLCCQIDSTHVFMSKQNFKSLPIPAEILARLQK